MEKIIFNLSKPEPEVEISFDGKVVKVKPYVNMSDRNVILNAYFEAYSEEPIAGRLTNQYGLILAVLDVLTNIDIKNVIIDELVDSGLWNKIADAVKNLNSVYDDIELIKADLRHQKSVEGKFAKILDSLQLLIEKIKGVDLSQEGISELLKNFDQVKSEIGKFYPVIESEVVPETKKKKPKKEG